MTKWKGILIALFLIILTVPGYSQFVLEGNVGFNALRFGDPAFAGDYYFLGSKVADIEIDLTFPSMFVVGAYGGYNFGSFELGAEFAFFKGEGESGEVYFDGIPAGADPGDFDVQFIRIGPAFRYFFNVGNPKLVPLIGASAGYVMSKVDIPDPPLKFDLGNLDIGVSGGVLYFFSPQFYLGGVIRVDYYLTIVKADVTPFVDEDVKDITVNGWIPASIYAYIGYRL